MGVKFIDLYTDLGTKTGIDIADSTNLTDLKRWTNDSVRDFQNKNDWDWKSKTDYIKMQLVEKTGTVTVTADSRTVTGDGTAFASTHVGCFFKLDSDSEWYEIIARGSATSITLRHAYMRATAATKTFKIWKKLYYLNPDVEKVNDFYLDSSQRVMRKQNVDDGLAIQNGWGSGDPDTVILHGVNRAISSYTTGTVSGTINTRTVTGASTEFLDNVAPGDEIVIGSYTYNVLTVDSDTQLTLVQNQLATSAASTTYSTYRRNVKGVEFNSTPPTYSTLIRYTYQQKTFDMQNDNDICEVPEQYLPIILEKAKSFAYGSLDDPRETTCMQVYEGKARETMMIENNKKSKPETVSWY